MNAKYIDLYGLTELQHNVVKVVDTWARKNKNPISHKEILLQMRQQNVKDYSTVNAIRALIKKHYIRTAVIISNKTYYVLLRSV